MCKITIITINFNNKTGLEKTINSVVSQTYQDIEYIVIDGASTDGSIDIITQYEHNISYWISESDDGIYNAMNKGVSKATGDYVLFLNSGDCLIDNVIIENIQADLLSGEDIIFGLLKCYPSGILGFTDVSLPITMLDFFSKSPIPHPASFIKHSLFKTFKFDESLKIVSDWKFFLETIALNGCSCKKIEKTITLFEESGISAQNKLLCKEERHRVLRELLPESIFADYYKFTSGMEFRGENYELFFSDLQQYKYRKIIYVISVLIIRIVAIFKKSARFAWRYPLF